MRKKIIITLIVSTMVSFVAYIFLFNSLIKPKIRLVALKEQQNLVIESKLSSKKTSTEAVLYPVKTINSILEKEIKSHHCLIEQLSTDMRSAIRADILANYQSIIHILHLIVSRAIGINCYYTSIKKSKLDGLLLLKIKCKYHG